MTQIDTLSTNLSRLTISPEAYYPNQVAAICDRLTFTSSVEVDISETLRVKVDDLFSGHLLHIFSNKIPEDQNSRETREKMVCKYAPQVTLPFKSRLPKLQALTDYNFNARVLDSLSVDIYRNKKQADNSVVYHVAIQEPKEYGKEGEHILHHAFIIEQYYNPLQKTDFFRIYQIRQSAMTCMDVSYEEINQFLLDLKVLTSNSNDLDQIAALRKKWFGNESTAEG